MRIKLIVTGKTTEKYLKTGIQEFEKRIKYMAKFEYIEVPDLKNTKGLKPDEVKRAEGELQLKKIQQGDTLILLDERGKSYSSIGFSRFLQKLQMSNSQNVVFLIGGPYGFSDKVYDRALSQLSVSKMTFSHQMIRLIFIEQIYRGYSILNNLPYHHE